MTRSVVAALIELCDGKTVASSRIPDKVSSRLLEDGVLASVSHGSRVQYRALPGLREHLATIDERLSNPEAYLRMLEGDSGLRSGQVEALGNSKAVMSRSCPGFPVNSNEVIKARLHGETLDIFPAPGTFLFIADWQDFEIPPDVLVVGVENMENFRMVSCQKYLFEPFGVPVLFVSRYPQSGDLVKWLCSIPNRYLHFGDLDLAGVNIYLTEFYSRLGSRASFFIPSDARERLARGSSERYTFQYDRFHDMAVPDPRVQPLVDMINAARRGYDQEGYVGTSTSHS